MRVVKVGVDLNAPALWEKVKIAAARLGISISTCRLQALRDRLAWDGMLLEEMSPQEAAKAPDVIRTQGGPVGVPVRVLVKKVETGRRKERREKQKPWQKGVLGIILAVAMLWGCSPSSPGERGRLPTYDESPTPSGEQFTQTPHPTPYVFSSLPTFNPTETPRPTAVLIPTLPTTPTPTLTPTPTETPTPISLSAETRAVIARIIERIKNNAPPYYYIHWVDGSHYTCQQVLSKERDWVSIQFVAYGALSLPVRGEDGKIYRLPLLIGMFPVSPAKNIPGIVMLDTGSPTRHLPSLHFREVKDPTIVNGLIYYSPADSGQVFTNEGGVSAGEHFVNFVNKHLEKGPRPMTLTIGPSREGWHNLVNRGVGQGEEDLKRFIKILYEERKWGDILVELCRTGTSNIPLDPKSGGEDLIEILTNLTDGLLPTFKTLLDQENVIIIFAGDPCLYPLR